MSDLERLERLPAIFASLAETAHPHHGALDSGLLIAGLAQYVELRATRGDLDAEARFRQVWGDNPALRAGIPPLVAHIADIVERSAPMRAACEVAGGADVDARFHAVLVLVIELVVRNKGGAIPEAHAPLLAELAGGELSLGDALARLPPRTGAPAVELPRKPPRPLADVFAELEAHARASGLPLVVLPLLAAAARYAEHADPALGATDVRALATTAELQPLPFSDWFAQATSLVGDDELRFDLPIPVASNALERRRLDVLLFLLESTVGTLDLDDDEIDDKVDGLVTGSLSLAAALGP